MAKNAKQRQQKLAAKNARRNRRKMIKAKPVALATRIEQAAHWPIVSAKVSGDLFEQGIGPVVLVRQAVNGTTAFAHFLVDTWCLGVKDVFVNIFNRDQAAARASELSSRMGGMKNVSPEYLKKLILKSFEYSLSLGIPPAEDFAPCWKILDGIDESLCHNEFEFGKDDKPMFIAGPHDGPARIRQVMDALVQTCGTDNFDYMLPIDPAEVHHGELYDRDGNLIDLDLLANGGEFDDEYDDSDGDAFPAHFGNQIKLASRPEKK